MTRANSTTERERFEEWIVGKKFEADYIAEPAAWCAWQARAQIVTQEPSISNEETELLLKADKIIDDYEKATLNPDFNINLVVDLRNALVNSMRRQIEPTTQLELVEKVARALAADYWMNEEDVLNCAHYVERHWNDGEYIRRAKAAIEAIQGAQHKEQPHILAFIRQLEKSGKMIIGRDSINAKELLKELLAIQGGSGK